MRETELRRVEKLAARKYAWLGRGEQDLVAKLCADYRKVTNRPSPAPIQGQK